MLEGVEFPCGVVTFTWSDGQSGDQDSKKLTTRVTNLDTCLTDVNGDDFPHALVRVRVSRRYGEGEEAGGRRRAREITRIQGEPLPEQESNAITTCEPQPHV